MHVFVYIGYPKCASNFIMKCVRLYGKNNIIIIGHPIGSPIGIVLKTILSLKYRPNKTYYFRNPGIIFQQSEMIQIKNHFLKIQANYHIIIRIRTVEYYLE